MIRSIFLKISIIAFVALFAGGCASAPDRLFLQLDDSKGFAGDISKAPDENRAPDRVAIPKVSLSAAPVQNITNSNNADPFTLPLSLRSLDTGLPLVVNLNQKNETYNYNLREIKAFNPSVINDIKRVDSFAQLKLEYIQFVSANDIDQCLAIDESGFFGLKSCSDDLNKKKFETVYQLIPLLSDAVEIRSLVLGGKECISTFFNPNLEPWQRVGILRCELREGFIVDTPKLWAIMPEIREAAVLVPID